MSSDPNQVARLVAALQAAPAAAPPAAAPAALSPAQIFQRNSAYAKPQKSYQTKLDPIDEAKFQKWVKANNIPFDPSPTADYDMRGFYKGLQTGDPNATTGMNANDGQLHYSDYWKTPYHKSFSNESKFATKDAPAWNEQDQLVLPNGNVVYDERAQTGQAPPQVAPSQ